MTLRCKACSSPHAKKQLDDWYCDPCARAIKKTVKEYTLGDLFEAFDGEPSLFYTDCGYKVPKRRVD